MVTELNLFLKGWFRDTISVESFSNKGHNRIAAKVEGKMVILSTLVGITISDSIDKFSILV